MDRFIGLIIIVREVVANDAVRGGGAQVVGEEGAPGDGRVDGVEDPVDSILLG